ncbi:MAG: hypothetical protein M1827_004315 [Pycnora praestabilis]|nr:MAG: hypothetical protein M1827_004315 [Pycnora praestabilis]
MAYIPKKTSLDFIGSRWGWPHPSEKSNQHSISNTTEGRKRATQSGSALPAKGKAAPSIITLSEPTTLAKCPKESHPLQRNEAGTGARTMQECEFAPALSPSLPNATIQPRVTEDQKDVQAAESSSNASSSPSSVTASSKVSTDGAKDEIGPSLSPLSLPSPTLIPLPLSRTSTIDTTMQPSQTPSEPQHVDFEAGPSALLDSTSLAQQASKAIEEKPRSSKANTGVFRKSSHDSLHYRAARRATGPSSFPFPVLETELDDGNSQALKTDALVSRLSSRNSFRAHPVRRSASIISYSFPELERDMEEDKHQALGTIALVSRRSSQNSLRTRVSRRSASLNQVHFPPSESDAADNRYYLSESGEGRILLLPEHLEILLTHASQQTVAAASAPETPAATNEAIRVPWDAERHSISRRSSKLLVLEPRTLSQKQQSAKAEAISLLDYYDVPFLNEASIRTPCESKPTIFTASPEENVNPGLETHSSQPPRQPGEERSPSSDKCSRIAELPRLKTRATTLVNHETKGSKRSSSIASLIDFWEPPRENAKKHQKSPDPLSETPLQESDEPAQMEKSARSAHDQESISPLLPDMPNPPTFGALSGMKPISNQPSPQLPPPRKHKLFVRKVRNAAWRTPMLKIALGRKLAAQTKPALRLLAKGERLDGFVPV